ncbi:hypothetical protein FU957_06295 [Campylobacter jejuni]|nr:hypothetical protein [Campylobacter jejuni]ECO3667743.1 hypothetical protein [Campylobacter jejuni]ECP9572335.1 hypothetical protein [Campylobacter jejuni]ECQ5760066.1 hypothetical protein [Campylobacter jejuni]MCW1871822.1 hypothetical protein [Campylobacter jejuni]HDZ4296136.1 hypothetical protein [Campylobacter jejuni]
MTSKHLYKVRLGEGYLKKGLDELIKLGSKNIDTHINKKINPDIKEKFDKILSPLKPENFQNILNGTFEVIKETQKISENNKTIDNPEDKKKDKNYFSKKVDSRERDMFGLTKNLFLNQYKTKRIINV